MAEKGFMAFQRAEMSPQGTQLNTISYIFPSSLKLNTVKPVLSGHSKRRPKLGFQNQISLNVGQKYCRMLQREHSAILSIFMKIPFVTKIVFFSFYYFFFTIFILILGGRLRQVLLYLKPVLAASRCTHTRMFAYT